MRISDWSSDVCSSDLPGKERQGLPARVFPANLRGGGESSRLQPLLQGQTRRSRASNRLPWPSPSQRSRTPDRPPPTRRSSVDTARATRSRPDTPIEASAPNAQRDRDEKGKIATKRAN